MTKRRTTSRQWSLVHRLNRQTSELRSRIYRLEENITDNEYIEVRDIGDLPWSWDDFGYGADIQYLHSTVRGFNQDYKQLTRQLNLESHIQSTIDNLNTILTREKNLLKEVAERDKVQFFGAKNGDTPLIETEYVQSLINGIDPDTTNNTQVQVVIQEMKNASNWYTWEGRVLSQLRDEYEKGPKTTESRDKFYNSVVDYIWDSWQRFRELPFETFVTPDDANAILNKIKSKKITKQTISNWVRYKNPSKSTPFGFAKELGLVYEDAIRENIVDYSVKRAKDLIIERIGQKGGIVDVALVQGTAKTTIKIDDLNRFTGGISAKLRHNNTFSIEVSGTPREFFSLAGAEFEQSLQALRYLYNNWMALSVYNTDLNRTYSNNGQQRTRKAKKLLDGGHLLSRSFQSLTRIANLILIQSAFFANAKDVGKGNICLFNQEYWNELIAQLDHGFMTIPAFVFTANDYYETWKIVQYYLNNSLMEPNDLFGSRQFLGVNKNLYNAGQLKRLYETKAKAIKDKNRMHADLPLYDVIHLSIGGPLNKAFIDCFDEVLHTNRKLSIQFRLISSSEL